MTIKMQCECCGNKMTRLYDNSDLKDRYTFGICYELLLKLYTDTIGISNLRQIIYEEVMSIVIFLGEYREWYSSHAEPEKPVQPGLVELRKVKEEISKAEGKIEDLLSDSQELETKPYDDFIDILRKLNHQLDIFVESLQD